MVNVRPSTLLGGMLSIAKCLKSKLSGHSNNFVQLQVIKLILIMSLRAVPGEIQILCLKKRVNKILTAQEADGRHTLGTMTTYRTK